LILVLRKQLAGHAEYAEYAENAENAEYAEYAENAYGVGFHTGIYRVVNK
jgi:hypothetical protein